MRALGLILLAFLLLLAGCGGSSTEVSEPPTSADEVSSPTMSKSGGDVPDGQPPVDGPLPDTRTGALPMPGAVCSLRSSGAPGPPRFDGTVTAIGSDGATFEVHEVFDGDFPDPVVIDLGPATTSRASESSPSYSVGTRLLVSVTGSRGLGCGDTRYFDEETAADWRS